MPSRSTVTVPITRVSTRDRESASTLIETIYGRGVKADYSASSEVFGIDFTVAPLGDLLLIKACVAGFDCVRTLDRRVQLYVPLRGKLFQQIGKNELKTADTSRGVIVRPGTHVRQSVKQGEALVLTFSIETIAERAELLSGSPPPADFIDRMPEDLDLSSALGAALVRNAKLAYAEMLELDSLGCAFLASGAYEEILTNIATLVLVPGVARALSQPGKQNPPATVRKARDYIEAHATDVIELSVLAAELGISMRTLQVNFQKEYGFSPRDYIMECRLALARKKLMDGCPITGVTDIALLCGFPNLSHFAAKYRDKYGELPSETIRKSRA